MRNNGFLKTISAILLALSTKKKLSKMKKFFNEKIKEKFQAELTNIALRLERVKALFIKTDNMQFSGC